MIDCLLSPVSVIAILSCRAGIGVTRVMTALKSGPHRKTHACFFHMTPPVPPEPSSFSQQAMASSCCMAQLTARADLETHLNLPLKSLFSVAFNSTRVVLVLPQASGVTRCLDFLCQNVLEDPCQYKDAASAGSCIDEVTWCLRNVKLSMNFERLQRLQEAILFGIASAAACECFGPCCVLAALQPLPWAVPHHSVRHILSVSRSYPQPSLTPCVSCPVAGYGIDNAHAQPAMTCNVQQSPVASPIAVLIYHALSIPAECAAS